MVKKDSGHASQKIEIEVGILKSLSEEISLTQSIERFIKALKISGFNVLSYNIPKLRKEFY